MISLVDSSSLLKILLKMVLEAGRVENRKMPQAIESSIEHESKSELQNSRLHIRWILTHMIHKLWHIYSSCESLLCLNSKFSAAPDKRSRAKDRIHHLVRSSASTESYA